MNKPQVAAEIQGISSELVAEYLYQNPDFFEAHPDLLNSIELAHSAGPKATSLIERQVSVLRDKNQALETQLRDLIAAARENEEFASKIDNLALALLAGKTRDDVVNTLEEMLRSQLLAEHAVLVLFLPSASDREPETRFLRLIDRSDESLAPFRTFLDMGTPRCGYIRDAQRDFLFGAGNIEIGSAALVPIGNNSETGFLAIGSRDADYFNPGQSMDFLARMGDLVAAALSSR